MNKSIFSIPDLNIIKYWKLLSVKFSLRIISIHIIVHIIAAIIFFPLIPVVLNYPPYIFENQDIYLLIYGFSYTKIFIIMIFCIIVAYIIILKLVLNGIDEWRDLATTNNSHLSKILNLRKKCLYTPYIIFIFEIIIPVALLSFLELFYLLFYTAPSIIFIKLSILLFSFATLSATISFILSKKYFTFILLRTYIGRDLAVKFNIKSKIFLQMIPIFIVAVLFTSLIGYSRLIDEKGNLIHKYYKRELKNSFPESYRIHNIRQVQADLATIELVNPDDFSFIVTPDNKIFTSSQKKLSKKFIIFMNYLASKFDGKVYDETGEIQGTVIKVKGAVGDWIIGVQFKVSSYEIVVYFIFNFLALLALTTFVLYYFSKTITDDINLISSNLTEIAEGEDINLNNKIAVTSNDEIGDLVIAFNKVQDREKTHIQNIKEQQRIIMERERLVSLGQMMGGITHNLKSPAVIIAGFLERMTVLEKQFAELLANDNFVKENYQKITMKLKNEIDEVKPYSDYISNLLITARDRAVQLNSSDDQSLSIAQLQTKIQTLVNYELKKQHCLLKSELKLDPQIIIRGEINGLVQVIHNIILNAIQAYKSKGGTIDLIIEQHEADKIMIIIRDYAGGIPEEIQVKLFREMITTKEQGSGLGLYMAYLTIKGRFGGELLFQSTEGEGATFYIIIPYHQENTREIIL